MSRVLTSGSKHLKGKKRTLMVMLVEGDETWNHNLPDGLSLMAMYPVDSLQLQLLNTIIAAVHTYKETINPASQYLEKNT